MKIACISDTHLRHRKFPIHVPEVDLLIHSGDACLEGNFFEVREFFEWWRTLKAKHKIFVAGNHDRLFEKEPSLAWSFVPGDTVYLQDSIAEIEGLKIYGSPWQPEFCNWSFNLPRGHRLREKWNKIPNGIDILVTHGPPMGILDLNDEGEHVGCQDLRDVVGRVKPRLHAFGHIHGAYGAAKVGRTLFVNASICDPGYMPTNAPIVVELSADGQEARRADLGHVNSQPLW